MSGIQFGGFEFDPIGEIGGEIEKQKKSIGDTLGGIVEKFGAGIGAGVSKNPVQLSTSVQLPIQQIVIGAGLIILLVYILRKKK